MDFDSLTPINRGRLEQAVTRRLSHYFRIQPDLANDIANAAVAEIAKNVAQMRQDASREAQTDSEG